MITISTIHRFITSLSFSIIVETLVIFFLLRVVFKNREIPAWRIVIASTFATFATIPYVWFVFPYALDWPRSTSLLWSEPFIAIVEAIFYRLFLKTSWKVAFTLSILSNASSYFLGPLLRAHGWWIYW